MNGLNAAASIIAVIQIIETVIQSLARVQSRILSTSYQRLSTFLFILKDHEDQAKAERVVDQIFHFP